jgi:hypothetical protein
MISEMMRMTREREKRTKVYAQFIRLILSSRKSRRHAIQVLLQMDLFTHPSLDLPSHEILIISSLLSMFFCRSARHSTNAVVRQLRCRFIFFFFFFFFSQFLGFQWTNSPNKSSQGHLRRSDHFCRHPAIIDIETASQYPTLSLALH